MSEMSTEEEEAVQAELEALQREALVRVEWEHLEEVISDTSQTYLKQRQKRTRRSNCPKFPQKSQERDNGKVSSYVSWRKTDLIKQKAKTQDRREWRWRPNFCLAVHVVSYHHVVCDLNCIVLSCCSIVGKRETISTCTTVASSHLDLEIVCCI